MKPVSIDMNDEFAQELLADDGPGEFRPAAFYHPHGDAVEFVARPDAYRAERLDDLVTIYVSEETDEIIGALIKSVRRICEQVAEQFPGARAEIQIEGGEGNVQVRHLIRARLWSNTAEDGGVVRAFCELLKLAEESRVEAKLAMA